MRTEAQFYNDHLEYLLDLLTEKIGEIENKGTMDDQDEMELDALDSLFRDVEGLLD